MDAGCSCDVQTLLLKRQFEALVKNRLVSGSRFRDSKRNICLFLSRFIPPFFLKKKNPKNFYSLHSAGHSTPIFRFLFVSLTSVIRHCWVLFFFLSSSWVSALATSWDLWMSLGIVRVKKKDCVKCMPYTCGMFSYDHGDKSETSRIKAPNPSP